MATLKQKRAAREIVESRCLKDGIKKAGYSDAMAHNPKQVTESKGFKEEIKPFTDQLEEEIQAAMKHLPKVRHEASYGEAVGAIEKMRKLKELLGGGATERVDISSEDTPEQQQLIDEFEEKLKQTITRT